MNVARTTNAYRSRIVCSLHNFLVALAVRNRKSILYCTCANNKRQIPSQAVRSRYQRTPLEGRVGQASSPRPAAPSAGSIPKGRAEQVLCGWSSPPGWPVTKKQGLTMKKKKHKYWKYIIKYIQQVQQNHSTRLVDKLMIVLQFI